MYRILPKVYDELSSQLRDRIGTGSYFAGSVETLSGDVRIHLISTLIIYRRTESRPEGDASFIDEVVPVWWECHAYHGSEELLNDFDFTLLRRHLED